jgi:hypothetical protein
LAACRTVDDAEQRPDGELYSQLQPRLELLPAPCVHADLAATSALAAPDEQCAAALIEIGFGEREHFLDAQSGAPEDHDQATDMSPGWARAQTWGSPTR